MVHPTFDWAGEHVWEMIYSGRADGNHIGHNDKLSLKSFFYTHYNLYKINQQFISYINIFMTWQKLSECEDAKSDLYRYIGKIVLSTSMEKREKLVVLLAHMEPLIYNALKISKAANIGPKQAVREVSEEKNEGMSVESLGKMYVFAITLIVFARTDSYTKKIDKRMPFRNNILHNGIVKLISSTILLTLSDSWITALFIFSVVISEWLLHIFLHLQTFAK